MPSKKTEKKPNHSADSEKSVKATHNNSKTSAYQKREKEPVNKNDTSDMGKAAGGRNSNRRNNITDPDSEYDTGRYGSYGLHAGLDRQSENYMEHDTYENNERQMDSGRRQERDYRDNYYPENSREMRNERYNEDYGHRYERRDERRNMPQNERYRQERFPEDRYNNDYLHDRYHPGFNLGHNRESRFNEYPEKGYRENQGQYSADNYDSPMRGHNPRGGMNYESGRSRYNDEGDYGQRRFRNYDAPYGGYNEERERNSSRFGHSRYRDQSDRYEGEGNYPGNYSRGYREDPRDSGYYRDPERENRRRNRWENDLW